MKEFSFFLMNYPFKSKSHLASHFVWVNGSMSNGVKTNQICSVSHRSDCTCQRMNSNWSTFQVTTAGFNQKFSTFDSISPRK